MTLPNLSISQAQQSHSGDLFNEVSLDVLAALLKAGGDRLRLDVLRVLKLGAFGVLELAQLFDVKQSGMSHHLKILNKAGLVETQREGNQIFYRRPTSSEVFPNHEGLGNIVHSIFEQVDKLPLEVPLDEKIKAIHAQRAELSQAFFSKHADRFRAHHELVAGYDLYGPACLELVQQTISEGKNATALEIGPGEGAFLEELSPLFDRLYALDNSQAMLEQAKSRMKARQLDNVSFLLGDTKTAIEHNLKVEMIVINMVLHHVASPADIFQDCPRLLCEGGTLIVTELTHHNQTWTREKCGDIWLGFEPTQLQNWASDAGLLFSDALHIGVRNGFQVQIQKFKLPGI